MKKVVFVGDKPSKTNVAGGVAFVGAACFKRLVEWIQVLDPDYYICFNSSPEELETIGKLSTHGFRVIALGKVASKALWDSQIPHFELPHPSGLNHKINDKTSLETWLDLAKTYIESTESVA